MNIQNIVVYLNESKIITLKGFLKEVDKSKEKQTKIFLSDEFDVDVKEHSLNSLKNTPANLRSNIDSELLFQRQLAKLWHDN